MVFHDSNRRMNERNGKFRLFPLRSFYGDADAETLKKIEQAPSFVQKWQKCTTLCVCLGHVPLMAWRRLFIGYFRKRLMYSSHCWESDSWDLEGWVCRSRDTNVFERRCAEIWDAETHRNSLLFIGYFLRGYCPTMIPLPSVYKCITIGRCSHLAKSWYLPFETGAK